MVDGTPLLFPHNGTWRFTAEVVRGLVSASHSVTVVFPCHVDVSTFPGNLGAVTIVCPPPKSFPLTTQKRLWWELVAFPRLARRFDMAIAPYFSWSGVVGQPGLVVAILDLWPLRIRGSWKYGVRKWLLRRSARSAWRVLTISEFIRHEIAQEFSRDAAVVPLGAVAPPRLATLEERGHRVLYVGGYESRKDVSFLIDAIRLVNETLPRSTEFLFVGNMPASIRAEVMALKGSVRCLGPVEEETLSDLYQRCRIFVYPSRYEGFGLPPLEAMAAGTPVVVRALTSLPEVVGRGGIITAGYDPYEFGRAILKLLWKDDVWKECHERALDRAGELTWESSHRHLAELVERWAYALAGDRRRQRT